MTPYHAEAMTAPVLIFTADEAAEYSVLHQQKRDYGFNKPFIFRRLVEPPPGPVIEGRFPWLWGDTFYMLDDLIAAILATLPPVGDVGVYGTSKDNRAIPLGPARFVEKQVEWTRPPCDEHGREYADKRLDAPTPDCWWWRVGTVKR